MLLDIFNDYSMPCYKLGDILFLYKIGRIGFRLFLHALQIREKAYLKIYVIR